MCYNKYYISILITFVFTRWPMAHLFRSCVYLVSDSHVEAAVYITFTLHAVTALLHAYLIDSTMSCTCMH